MFLPNLKLIVLPSPNLLWGKLFLPNIGVFRCALGDGLLLLPTTCVGQCALGVDVLLLLCLFLGACVHYLNLWLLKFVLLVVYIYGCWLLWI